MKLFFIIDKKYDFEMGESLGYKELLRRFTTIFFSLRLLYSNSNKDKFGT